LRVTSATIVIFGAPVWDPVVLVTRIGGAGVVIFAALVVLMAQLTTNMAANVVSPSNDFSNLSPRRISYVTGGLITAVIGIVMMPWKLYSDAAAYIFTWLLGYSSLMGALGGILIADYWVFRKQQLDVTELFREQGRYTYKNGVNMRAIAALVIAILPVAPGFIRAVSVPGGTVSDPNFFDRLYSYAWFVTFVLSFVLYLLFIAPRVSGSLWLSRRRAASRRLHAPSRRLTPLSHELRPPSRGVEPLQADVEVDDIHRRESPAHRLTQRLERLLLPPHAGRDPRLVERDPVRAHGRIRRDSP
jgi:hypothetical protein